MQEPAEVFEDRTDAGRRLAERLDRFAGREDVVVLALPRGGVPVAVEIARRIRAPLDLMVVRKLGVPGQEELAMGAIASGGVRVLNEEVIAQLSIPEEEIARAANEEERELERRERAYRGDRPTADVAGRTVILVDDGIATGSTVRAAVQALRVQGAARIVVATPTAPAETCDRLAREVDEVICLTTPEPFFAISLSYREFPQLADDEVRELIQGAEAPPAAGRA
jgi:putative phosphoribosyl transferase